MKVHDTRRLEPGFIIDRYEVIRRIAEGGMASVYEVQHTALRSRVALKVLHPEMVVNDEVRSRFVREGRILAQISHEQIVRVSDVVAAPGIAGLLMDLLEGPSLDAFIDDLGGPCPLERVFDLMVPLVGGVAELHTRDIVHRDLKPENIIVVDGGKRHPRPVIVDFGIAMVGDQSTVKHTMRAKTRAGQRMGTPSYMSPEQVRSADQADHRTDIFALGAILYELLTGTVAYSGDTDFDVMKAIVDGRYRDPRDIVPTVPLAWAMCVKRAMATAPSERYQSCSEMVAALHEAAAEDTALEPVVDLGLAQPSSSVPAPTRRRRTIVLAVVAALGLPLCLLAAAATVLAWSSGQKAKSRDLAAIAMSTLEHHKTDKAANEDKSVLSDALRTGEEAVSHWETPEALGARALAGVWSDGWHLAGFSVDDVERHFTRADAITQEAAVWRHAEALLARALMLAGACTQVPDDHWARRKGCTDAERAFREVEHTLTSDRRAWLRFEMWWTAAGFHIREASRAWEAGDQAAARHHWTETLRICDAGTDDLDQSPVNDIWLVRQCIVAAGNLEDFARYYYWSRWLRLHDQAEEDDRIKNTSAQRIFRGAHPECAQLRRSSDRSFRHTWVPAANDTTARFCYVAGLLALDCNNQAQEVLWYVNRKGELGDLPWQPLLDAYSTGGQDCFLERR